MAFPPLRNSDYVVASFSIDFLSNSEWDALSNRIAYDYSHADWDSLCDHLRDVPWEHILKYSSSASSPKMVEKVIMNIDLSKASGRDCIPVVVLKNYKPELSYILAKLFKESCFQDC